MKVIGFAGRKYMGKDTAAQVLREPPYGFYLMNFADPVRRVCEIAFDLHVQEMRDPELKQTKLKRWPYQTPRELMQFIGQGLRESYPDMWVEAWRRRASEYRDYVITDVRYHNEVAMIHEYGGKVIRIINPRILHDEFSNDRSETEPDELKVDGEVINDATIGVLHDRVRHKIRDLM
jgi:hypothetical protein